LRIPCDFAKTPCFQHFHSKFSGILNGVRYIDKGARWADGYAYESHAFDFYLMGLVDKVGWETYKKVLRSYADEPGVLHSKFPGGQISGRL
jgi:hypothetical protein